MACENSLASSQAVSSIGTVTWMPLPPESLTKLSSFSALSRSRTSRAAATICAPPPPPPGGAVLRPPAPSPGIEVEDDAVAGLQTVEPRAAHVNLQRAGLHQ